MEWNGMEWNGMEWNGMEWYGMVFIKLVLFFPCRRVFVIDYMLWDCVVWLVCCCLALPKCSLILRADALCPIVFWPEWW